MEETKTIDIDIRAIPEKYEGIITSIFKDPRYKAGLRYGVPRKGHPEGTVGKHLVDLQCNLVKMRTGGIVDVKSDEYWKLFILILVHDIMKHAATPDSAIADPNSHASLARKFLAEFSDDEDLQNIVQAHDENLALWLNFKTRGHVNFGRLQDRVINKIKDIELLLLFQIIDGATEGKTDMKEMLRWFVDEVNVYRSTPRVYKALELFGL